MNGKTAKKLRKMARIEMAGNRESVERELVIATIRGHDRVINEPLSVRAMSQHLKTAYKRTVGSAR
jgi:hypothetical protein